MVELYRQRLSQGCPERSHVLEREVGAAVLDLGRAPWDALPIISAVVVGVASAVEGAHGRECRD